MFGACTKADIQPSAESSPVASQDVSANAKANNILTSHSWMYNAFYMHYIDKNHKGDPLYVRGASNNQDEILATDRFTFKTDHSFVQTEGDYTYRGTWRFSDKVPTVLFMKYDWGTDEDSIVNFNSNRLNFTQSFGYHDEDKSYTELIPAQ
jgi:hypothetical protein